MTRMTGMRRSHPLHLASTDEGNDLLAANPFALLVGMLLDQQIPMEKAFTSPAVLAQRLGGELTPAAVAAVAALDADDLETVFRTPPALHRFPAAMAKRVQALAQSLVDGYGGDTESVWTQAADGPDLVTRIAALPGFGAQKARIFTALLGKQFGVAPAGWREAAGSYGDHDSFRSIADVVDADSLGRVRTFKQQQKAAAKA